MHCGRGSARTPLRELKRSPDPCRFQGKGKREEGKGKRGIGEGKEGGKGRAERRKGKGKEEGKGGEGEIASLELGGIDAPGRHCEIP